MSASHTSSGGITLNFTGTDLDSVQRPTLVINDHTAIPPVHTQLLSCRLLCMALWWYFHLLQRTVCRPESPTLLVCTAPALSGGDPGDSINYTLIMDNAPGPSNTGDLRLSLVPNPSIATDGSALVNQQFRAETVIQIRVYISAIHPYRREH